MEDVDGSAWSEACFSSSYHPWMLRFRRCSPRQTDGYRSVDILERPRSSDRPSLASHRILTRHLDKILS
ncbi:hypothetical protein O181_000831 [Austropuccinia psidii MF-1]|uniref:Uncharacterized protein n=1 Tax=Austropuccinia psidii MF-1 TaxID=1389203 RepID=A0A9Q3B985_9BASI|nr:hypothetical protein [Austropuccinia psidii MF-1]